MREHEVKDEATQTSRNHEKAKELVERDSKVVNDCHKIPVLSDGVEYSTSEYEYEYEYRKKLRVRVLILKNVLEYEYRKKVRVRVRVLLQV